MFIEKLTIDNITYQTKELFELSRRMVLNLDIPKWKRDIFSFILDWMSPDDTIHLETSGTTGTAKSKHLLKSAMVISANNTLQYFNLKKGDHVLLCLSTAYIAGMMMVVRAIIGELNLILTPPESNPWKNITQKVKFVAAVPIQLQSLLESEEYKKLFHTVLVGGVPLNQSLIEKISHTDLHIFQSFGMTETLSHVAVRRLKNNIEKTPYQAMKGVTFSVNQEGCLIIQADYLQDTIHTKDVVSLIDEHSFLWKGRADNIINSGGVKLYPEQIESKLSSIIAPSFFITGLPDDFLNEKVVLFIEEDQSKKINIETLKKQFAIYLDKYEIPKEVVLLPSFKRTKTGKIKRQETIMLVKKA